MKRHDERYKQLITVFFREFVLLFLPELGEHIDFVHSPEFIQQEVLHNIPAYSSREVDLLVKVKYQGQDVQFLVHIENQATHQADFPKRMFDYSSALMLQHGLPVYPIALLSYNRPIKPAPSVYELKVAGANVLRFEYRVIQLNQLSWRSYLEVANPVAVALMAAMNVPLEERARVRVQCMRALLNLKLDSVSTALVVGFVEDELPLTDAQRLEFERDIGVIPVEEQVAIMELTTSWWREGREAGMQVGLEEGRQEGRQEGQVVTARKILVRLAEPRLGKLTPQVKKRLDSISDADVLEELIIQAMTANSWNELLK